MEFSIRAATLEDCRDLARMTREVSEYHHSAAYVTQTDLEQDGFSENPFFRALIAEVPEQQQSKDGHTKIGFAFYCYSYHPKVGRVIYLQVLYVAAEFRGKDIGKALLKKVAKKAVSITHRTP